MLQTYTHYGCHILIPLLVAIIGYRKQWKRAFLVMIAGFLIDLDHLLANPIFDPNRCSINYHPLHSSFAILFYIFLLVPKKSRLVALGLVIHIIADVVDCSFM
ncbi:hypothetical protein A8C32_17925 [Flavivirga aquatica]|uniref:Metal-dependent hydrolase n=1 Tax=Flavivirga aquatica TaxID=1849968 RepID=A0A1E5T7N7_9FLAO|nr:DUF6122 family protein [Flavivirga aquatica]OEK07317.1 hypothetical protein A8C32_17925 [Flavivirga aquatica]